LLAIARAVEGVFGFLPAPRPDHRPGPRRPARDR